MITGTGDRAGEGMACCRSRRSTKKKGLGWCDIGGGSTRQSCRGRGRGSSIITIGKPPSLFPRERKVLLGLAWLDLTSCCTITRNDQSRRRSTPPRRDSTEPCSVSRLGASQPWLHPVSYRCDYDLLAFLYSVYSLSSAGVFTGFSLPPFFYSLLLFLSG